MTEPHTPPNCPECMEPSNDLTLNRRGFVRLLGGVALTGVGAGRLLGEETTPLRTTGPKPAESLIAELFSTLNAEQKKTVALPFNHGNNKTRLGMYNSPLNGNSIAKTYSKAQQELVERIVRAIVNGEEGFKTISRNNTWDSSKTFDGCGAHIFGEPGTNKPFAFLFTGHHLTLRCDGNLEDGLVWGGPLYYGHSAYGHAATNVYSFQTRTVNTVFRALDEKQQKQAVVAGLPGDTYAPRKVGDKYPGISGAELTVEQKALVERALCDLLTPFRKEDADEVIAAILATGGLDKLSFAFHRDADAKEGDRWNTWRVEGPGFVWNFRALPHVHCRVLIGKI